LHKVGVRGKCGCRASLVSFSFPSDIIIPGQLNSASAQLLSLICNLICVLTARRMLSYGLVAAPRACQGYRAQHSV
jgi:hypothetical protein